MNWTCSGFVPMEVPLGITYGNGTYVVVGEDGYDPELDGSVGLIATSSDGITWTAQDGPPGYSVMGGPAGYWLPTDLSYGYTGGLAFGNGLFVAALALMDTESHNS